MFHKTGLVLLALFLPLLFAAGQTEESETDDQLIHYPADKLAGVLTRDGVAVDKEITSDGGGSLRIEASEAGRIRLYETGDIDVENARLIYQAELRTEDVKGRVYLEMWCHFPGKGEYFSRALHAPVTGTTEWTHQETPFFLKAGQNPDNVKLNLIIDGTGTVWIDNIHLVKGPLE